MTLDTNNIHAKNEILIAITKEIQDALLVLDLNSDSTPEDIQNAYHALSDNLEDLPEKQATILNEVVQSLEEGKDGYASYNMEHYNNCSNGNDHYKYSFFFRADGIESSDDRTLKAVVYIQNMRDSSGYEVVPSMLYRDSSFSTHSESEPSEDPLVLMLEEIAIEIFEDELFFPYEKDSVKVDAANAILIKHQNSTFNNLSI